MCQWPNVRVNARASIFFGTTRAVRTSDATLSKSIGKLSFFILLTNYHRYTHARIASSFFLRATNTAIGRRGRSRERALRKDARWLHFRPTTPRSGCNRFNFKFKRRLNLNLTGARFHVVARRSKIQNSVSIIQAYSSGRKPQS